MAGALGALPHFIVAGTTKGGTTSLFWYLLAHPKVWMPERKELHYFDGAEEGRHDEDWYRSQFPADTDRVIGEITPGYLAAPKAAARMAALVPDVRLICLLRHPVDRAYSHYWQNESRWPTGVSFSKSVAKEAAGEKIDPPHDRYLRVGRYAEHLERFYEHFPRERVLVRLTEDLSERSAETYGEICEFIGVDPMEPPENVGKVYNRTRPVRSATVRKAMVATHSGRWAPRLTKAIDRWNRPERGYPPLDAETRAMLLRYFEPYNASLEKLIGRDLSAWNR